MLQSTTVRCCPLLETKDRDVIPSPSNVMTATQQKIETATFGTGCFWCTEAIFTDVEGVLKVTSGYTGGHTNDPTYKEICGGNTGHAEVVQVEFDSSLLSFQQLLQVFWFSHDPTSLNRQGNDVGTQYRSAIFYHSVEQQQQALASKDALEAAKIYDRAIVTEIQPIGKFYAAEDYHQGYYQEVGDRNPYCSAIITPKVSKFRKEFYNLLKKK